MIRIGRTGYMIRKTRRGRGKRKIRRVVFVICMSGRKERRVLELRRRLTTSMVGYGQYEKAIARKMKDIRKMILMVR
jgi:hypothetical protein